MNDKNKDSTNPDFGFIMNQNAPAVAQPKRNKKFVLLIVLIGVLFVVGLLGALLSAKSNVATNGTAAATATSADAAKTFISTMAKSDVDLQTDITPFLGDNLVNDGTTTSFALQRLKDSIDFTTCTQPDSSVVDGEYKYICQPIDGGTAKANLLIKISGDKVTAFEVTV